MSDKKYLNIGLFAHVDAGKTTVCERLLYEAGLIKEFGRVDKHESFLDYLEVERKRGITVFSKQAVFTHDGVKVTLIDTPGHEDFFAETLRAMEAVDAAILIIDASRDITDYAKRLYFALFEHGIPVILFFNKMDIARSEREELLRRASEAFETEGVDFSADESSVHEACALYDESLLARFLEGQKLERDEICKLVAKRLFIPVYFGSALKGEGAGELLDIFVLPQEAVSATLSGRVYRVSFDKGARLLHTRLLGGEAALKESFNQEKIEEIRLYSGARYEPLKTARAGMCVAFRGISEEAFGGRSDIYQRLEPRGEPFVLKLPAGSDIKKSYDRLSLFFEQLPECRLFLDVGSNTIYLNIMGPVMEQVLLYLLEEELGFSVSFEPFFPSEEAGFEEIDYEQMPEVLDDEYEDAYEERDLHSETAPFALGLEEIEAIISRAGGSNKKSQSDSRRNRWNRYKRESKPATSSGPVVYTPKTYEPKGEDYLLVDGYNCIFAWEELTSISTDNIAGARDALVEILSEYAAISHKSIILVFDAYKVSGGIGSIEKIRGIDVVYTRHAQTADAYIELTSHELSKENRVTVATSDRLEQIIVRGQGAMVLSASDLLFEIADAKNKVREKIEKDFSGPLSQPVKQS